jgi:hypothetical protein
MDAVNEIIRAACLEKTLETMRLPRGVVEGRSSRPGFICDGRQPDGTSKLSESACSCRQELQNLAGIMDAKTREKVETGERGDS